MRTLYALPSNDTLVRGNGGIERVIRSDSLGSPLERLRNAACKVPLPTITFPSGHAEDTRIRDAISSPAPPLLDAGVRSRARQRGQSIAEFSLVVPILLVLFVAIADFGRVFAAGIAVEAATRNAAEAAANEYLANPPPPSDLSIPADGTDQGYYSNLRAYAAKVVCASMMRPMGAADPRHRPARAGYRPSVAT